MAGKRAGVALGRHEEAVEVGGQDHVLARHVRRQSPQQRGFRPGLVLGTGIEAKSGDPVRLGQAVDAVEARGAQNDGEHPSTPAHMADGPKQG